MVNQKDKQDAVQDDRQETEQLTEQQEHDTKEYALVYTQVMTCFAMAQISIDAACGIAIDILVSCALNATNGDFSEAGKVIKERIMPDLLQIAEKLERNEYEIVRPVDIAGKEVLDKFDIKNKRAN